MRQRFVLALFAAGALLLSAAAAPAFFGLHAPGDFAAAYGLTLAELAVDLRHTANAVSAVMFEFRGLDTLGEELILFAAVTAVSILLRGMPGESERRESKEEGAGHRAPTSSAALRWWCWPLATLLFVYGASLILHGHLSPGGGFQGGVVLAAAAGVIYACNDYGTFRRLGSQEQVQRVEGVAIAAMLLAGVPGLWAEGVLLANVLPAGTLGELLSGGLVLSLNVFAGIAVGASFTVLAGDFLEQTVMLRAGRWS